MQFSTLTFQFANLQGGSGQSRIVTDQQATTGENGGSDSPKSDAGDLCEEND